MRILHVISSLSPRAGGPPVIAASLAAAQAQLGHNVQLLSYAHAQAFRPHDPEPLGDEIPGWSRVKHTRLPEPTLWERLFATGARRAVSSMADQPQVIHLHSVWESILPVTAAWCRRRRVPYVVLVNGMLHPWSMAQSSLKKRVALMVRYRRMLDGASAIHVGNAAEREVVAAMGLRAPTVDMANGIWPQKFEPPSAPGLFRRQHPELGEAPFILFLSRLHHKKGPDLLLESFRLLHQRMPDVRLVIAGNDAGAMGQIERGVASFGLRKHTLLPGPLFGEIKRAALAEAACFCLPSRQEGFPVAVLEAMAAGLAVVVSRECNMPELESHNAGLVLPLAPPAFADALQQVLGDHALRRRLGESARSLVLSEYSWNRIAQQSIELYARLV